MEIYKKQVEIRWSDLDPNLHMRHSVYYDMGAYCRITFLNEQGFNGEQLAIHKIGPIIFREECVFKREIRFEDKVEVTLQLLTTRRDGSRWTMAHEIWKNDSILAAIITLDGAWIDLEKRKLALPPQILIDAFGKIPKAENFRWME